MTEVIESRDTHIPVRMPIDRVFTITGFGTVVTGTLIEGSVKVGQELVIYPEQLPTKVRNIQVHGTDQEVAYAGQRVAINIANIHKDDIHRGDVLAVEDTLYNSYMLDVHIKLLKHSNRVIDNWTRLRLYTGTKEVLCRAVLLDTDVLNPGDESFVQLRLEEPIACKYGDHFVVRFYSPLETIGGGIVLEPNASKHKRFKDDVLKELDTKMQGDMGQILENTILKNAADYLEAKDLMLKANLEQEQFDVEFEKLLEIGAALKFDRKLITHRAYLDETGEQMLQSLNKYHAKYPLRKGMSKEEIRSRFFKNVRNKHFDAVLRYFIDAQMIETIEQTIKAKGYEVTVDDKLGKVISSLEKVFESTQFKTPLMSEAFKEVGENKINEEVVNYLIETDRLVKISDAVYFHKTALEEAQKRLIDHLESNGSVTLGDFRALLDTSRKYVIPLLEYFDQIKITKRDGDKRVRR